ncbi:integrase catalytic domain-containing protein [Nephila pilipes]|uniref:Integrase catalytic domain-containing protein n=1 Tax=Nephila pilipes TaxID=299642 RepID=A0A8X6MUJ2_NEPPI|nr:integrase catalytic domain-containing protein [Nephila pilipes]
MIDKHRYMDDFLASAEAETNITMLYHEIKDLMTLMKLPMEKWATNSLKLKKYVRHPFLLEGNHPFVLLLIRNTHVRLHLLGTRIVLSELRSDFWILRGRQAIKKVLPKCLPCKLSKLKCENQIEGPLPSERVTPSVSFSTTGNDIAGPLYVRNKSPSDTAYIALIICATTRALHIKLVSDLSTDKFLSVLQRFVGRR